jgi:hypothetical protein
MRKVTISDRTVSVVMAASVGTWLGIYIYSSESERVSSIVFFAAICLTFICAVIKVWMCHIGQKQEKAEKQQNTDS